MTEGTIFHIALLVIILCVLGWGFKQFLYLKANIFGPLGLILRELQKTGAVEDPNRTEKSVSDVTRLLLPKIQRDFPDFSWKELKKQTEVTIRSVVAAVEQRDPEKLVNPSDRIREAVTLKIAELKEQEKRRHYESFAIHRTAIREYRKSAGSCVIDLATSARYLTRLSGNGVTDEEKKTVKIEAVINSRLVYIQDLTRHSASEKVLGHNCPNCGAPIENPSLGKCPYCGAALSELNLRVWSLEAISFETDKDLRF